MAMVKAVAAKSKAETGHGTTPVANTAYGETIP